MPPGQANGLLGFIASPPPTESSLSQWADEAYPLDEPVALAPRTAEVRMSTLSGKRTCLYDTPQLVDIVNDMARQAAGLLAGRNKVAVIGIRRRGVPLADRLTAVLASQYHLAAPLRLDLVIKRYADDLSLLYPETSLTEELQLAKQDLSGYTLLVVDDVLYTGHSLLRAVEYLARKQPAEIRVVALVDRGATRLPVRTDVVGMRLDVAPADIIECHVPPYEPEFKIVLLQRRG